MKTKEILHQRAEALSRSIESKELATEKILICTLDSEWYGLKLDCVREVIKIGKIAVLPSVPEQIKGLVNLRGNVLSITDLRPLLGLISGGREELRTVVVVEQGGVQTGILVETIYGVIEISSKLIKPPLLTMDETKGEYLIGEFQYEGKLVGLLNCKSLLALVK